MCEGTYKRKDDYEYQGGWKDNQMDGEGVLRMANGEKYRGMFRANKKNGKATVIHADGSRFDGTFKDDVKDGDFIEYDRNGNVVRKGKYVNGQLQ